MMKDSKESDMRHQRKYLDIQSKLKSLIAKLAATVVAAFCVGCPAPDRGGNVAITPALAASSTNPYGLEDVGLYVTPCLANIDNDGNLNTFIDEYFGNTIFFRSTTLL